MTDEIQALIRQLDHDEVGEQRRAGTALLAIGTASVPALIDALDTGSARVRRSAAFLLGSFKRSEDALAGLTRALTDPEPKVRKNAAIALGSLGSAAAVPALAAALDHETIGWVRPSLILALGAIGGEAACDALRNVTPGDRAEQDALRKAQDRTTSERQPIDWERAGAARLRLLLAVPTGLEDVAADEAAQQGIEDCPQAGPGLLRCPAGTVPSSLLPTLRCVYHLLVDAGHTGPVPWESPEQSAATVAALVWASAELRTIREWLRAGTEPIRYRLSIEPKHLRRETARAILDAVRATCSPLGLVDSPSRYDIELLLRGDATGSRLLIRPSFMPDPRFAYRQKDVGASINPVVAACLARLLRTSGGATVLDPTCGSGTLLIERAFLDRTSRLFGLDISRTAVVAARTNAQAAGLARRVNIGQGDATQSRYYRACDEAIANLPFGLRTGRADTDLARLYQSILDNLAGCLRPGGRALMYTTNKKMLDGALAHHRATFTVERESRVLSGGLWGHLSIIRHV